MAALEAAFNQARKSQLEKTGNKKVRLVADANITPRELQKVFVSYCNFKGSGDLWSLVAPPPGGPMTFGWKTTVCADWVARTIGLYWDLSLVAPNTKLLGQTVRRALKLMLDDRTLVISPGKEPADVIDKIDTTVRIVFGMLRTLKTQQDDKKKAFRQLSAGDQAKVELVLGNIKLPVDYVNEDDDDEADTVRLDFQSNKRPLAITDAAPSTSAPPVRKSSDVFRMINNSDDIYGCRDPAPQSFASAPQLTATASAPQLTATKQSASVAAHWMGDDDDAELLREACVHVPAEKLKNTKPKKLDKKKAEEHVVTKKTGTAIVKKPASHGCENVT